MPNQSLSVRAAYDNWPWYNANLAAVVGQLTEAQLAMQPTPERWPIWASIGHLACQRISWLCDFAGVPRVEATPFPNALYECPGDEDLENVLSASQLVEVLGTSFEIIETCLDTWTINDLSERIVRTWGDNTMDYSKGSVIQRIFAHDISHAAELNEFLSRQGLALVNFWD